MLGGILAASAAIAMLVRDAQTGWTMEMALMPVLVILTILAAHLAAQAFRAWRFISAAAMILLAAFADWHVLRPVGRRA